MKTTSFKVPPRFSFLLFPLLLVLLGTACSPLPSPSTSSHLRLRREKELRYLLYANPPLHFMNSDWKTWKNDLRSFYRERSYQFLWFQGVQDPYLSLNQRGQEFLKKLERIRDDGLNPEDYYHSILQEGEKKIDPLYLEILYSLSFLKVSRHLAMGKVLPWSDDSDVADATVEAGEKDETMDAKSIKKSKQAIASIKKDSREFSAINYLKRVNIESPSRIVDELRPSHPAYHKLKEALHFYRMLSKADTLPPLPPGQLPIKKGDRDPRLALLRQKLVLQGELSSQAQEKANQATSSPSRKDLLIFDTTLEMALKSFQRRHGLAANGYLDESTWKALNVPVSKRVRQLELNLERWRWVPRSLGERYILVNLADFHLTAVDRDNSLHMKVIVGKSYRPTPVFVSKITSMILNPTWTVPRSLFLEDILPEIRKNLAYLEERNFKVYQIQNGSIHRIDPSTVNWEDIPTRPDQGPLNIFLRQDPGPFNPLGKIKFRLPNSQAIYLHDTSNPASFSLRERSLSSGCIRLERPWDLAAFLLSNDPDWHPTNIKDVLKQWSQELAKEGKSKKLLLKNPTPVYLFYWTAWVNSSGIVHFRDDIYNRDSSLSEQLFLDTLGS